jgi:hypothetical protein
MKHLLLALTAIAIAALVAGINATSAATNLPPLKQAGPHEAEFHTFYDAFLRAVRANDKEKIADMIQYPVSAWDIDVRHNVSETSIKDHADFIKRYDILFTSSMRLYISKAKPPAAIEDNRYVLIWRETNVECSMEFGYFDGTGYRVTSFGIGPV